MSNDYYVYVYLDPRRPGIFEYEGLVNFPYEPFYVGKGRGQRYTSHIREVTGQWKPRQTRHYKYNKILKILAIGLVPVIQRIEEGLSEGDAYALEERLICSIGRLVDEKGPLTNILENNEFGLMDQEARKRGVETRRRNGNYAMTQEQKEKLRQAHTGKKQSKEHIAARIRGRQGYTHSEETKQKMRESAKRIHREQITQSWQDPEIAEKRKLGISEAYAKKRAAGVSYMWINNGEREGKYEHQKAQSLLDQGWKRGRIKKL